MNIDKFLIFGYSVNMKKVSIIRERGQLTIPESIRKIVPWATPMSAVTVSVDDPSSIIIRPNVQKFDEDKIWKNIRKARAIKGKGTMSAAEFLETDRRSH